MKKHTDLMVDLETLAPTPNAHVLSIGAYLFSRDSWDDEEHIKYDPFHVILGLADQGRDIDPDTQSFWAQQSKEARASVGLTSSTYLLSVVDEPLATPKDAMLQLADYVEGHDIKRVWAWRAAFDFPILRSLGYRPWPWYRELCAKTWFEAAVAAGFEPTRFPPVIKHNAGDDAKAQAETVAKAFRKV